MTLRERLAWALARLAEPPARDWIARPAVRGESVARFVLPLELCMTTNRTGRAAFAVERAMIGRLKGKLADLMACQCIPRRKPLAGRPQVLAVRFSPREPDVFGDFAKWPVDILCRRTAKHRHRLNLIEDDRPRRAEVHQWWEPGPKGDGFVFLEVRA